MQMHTLLYGDQGVTRQDEPVSRDDRASIRIVRAEGLGMGGYCRARPVPAQDRQQAHGLAQRVRLVARPLCLRRSRCEMAVHPAWLHVAHGVRQGSCTRHLRQDRTGVVEPPCAARRMAEGDRRRAQSGVWKTEAQSPMTKRVPMEGQQFGRLRVIAYAGYRGGSAHYQCRCACGQMCVVSRRNLRSRRGTKSCGCWRREQAKAKIPRMQAGLRRWKAAKAQPFPVQHAPRRYGTRPLRWST